VHARARALTKAVLGKRCLEARTLAGGSAQRESERDSFRMGIGYIGMTRGTLVCPCLLKTVLTTPAIYLRRVPFALTFFRPVDETSREAVILVFTG